METLNDLLFRVRRVSAGRGELLSARLGKRREVLSSSDFIGGVHALALAMEERGLVAGDRVAIYAENRPEWHLVDFACHLLGLVTVPLYPTLPPQQVAYILRNSGSRWVFFSDRAKGELLQGLESALTAAPEAVAFEGEAAVPNGTTITRLMGQGAEQRGSVPLERFRNRVKSGDLASIVYTSGTTGDPKGVMLSHGNFVANVLGCAKKFSVGPEDQALSLLPLSHVFQRTVDYLCFHQGVAICYVPAIEKVASALKRARPTIFTAVPRLYERIHQHAMAKVAKESPARQRLVQRSLAVGKRLAAEGTSRWRHPWLHLQHWAARRFVFGGLRERFGGRLRLPICGGAPLGREVAELFAAAGLPIYEGYGLTESAPVLAAGSPGHWRIGSVGKAVDGVELSIARDGEIRARGPNIMRWYWENPAATEEVLDADGWLHTGDLCHFDDDGFLFVTDRLKELIKVKGFQVAPAELEALLITHPNVSDVAVVGRPDDRSGEVPVAHVVPSGELDIDELRRWVADQVADYKQLADVVIAEAIPKNPSGKILRRELRSAVV